MKFANLFVLAVFFCIPVGGCIQTQKQPSSTDDVIWKATVTYCLTTETPNLDEPQFEDCTMYDFQIIQDHNSFRKLINFLYDSAISKTYPAYKGDFENYNPINLLSPKEKARLVERIDSAEDENNNMKVIKTAINSSWITGLHFNREWLYNSKTNSIISTISDVSLCLKFPTHIESVGLKFSKRTTDTGGIGQEALKPEIAWARDMPMMIDDSMFISWRGENDTLFRYSLNGVKSKLFEQHPIPIKTTFNKKLVEWIWKAARNGVLPAYYDTGENKIGSQIPAKDMKDFGYSIDTMETENGPWVVVKNELGPIGLNGLEIKEEICFHRDSFKFESKITYAAILIKVLNKNTGQIDPAASKVLYWVKLN